MKIKIVASSDRPKPRAGDRRVTKKHGLQIRVQEMATSFGGARRPIGRIVSNGRPVFSWVAPKDLEVWDRHHLTPEEREALFPEERIRLDLGATALVTEPEFHDITDPLDGQRAVVHRSIKSVTVKIDRGRSCHAPVRLSLGRDVARRLLEQLQHALSADAQR